MAATDVLTTDALTQKLQSEKAFREIKKHSFFMGMSSTAGGNVVKVKEDFMRSKGDKVTMPLINRLKNKHIGESGTVYNNEEKLTWYDYSMTLEEFNIPISWKTKLAAQRVAWNLPSECRLALDKRAGEIIDEELFEKLEASPTKVLYPGAATSTATLTTSTKMDAATLFKAKVGALGGFNRTQAPMTPIGGKGKNNLLFVCGLDMWYDLARDPEIVQAQEQALPRSDSHILFNDGDLYWRGITIKAHENINLYTTGGAGGNVAYSYGYLMGEDALCWAWGQKPETVTEEKDYGREIGVNVNFLGVAGKPVFNSKDYGVVAIAASRTQINDG
jgi:N4-gp56 family major capsid protein